MYIRLTAIRLVGTLAPTVATIIPLGARKPLQEFMVHDHFTFTRVLCSSLDLMQPSHISTFSVADILFPLSDCIVVVTPFRSLVMSVIHT